MFPFTRLKWREMQPLVFDLIERISAGQSEPHFELPIADFARVFAPAAPEQEFDAVRARGSIFFVPDSPTTGAFALAEGAQATFDLGREGLHLRIPVKMNGVYEVFDDGFRITFNENAELLGCKRVVVLICNRVTSVDVTRRFVRANAAQKMFDLLIEFD